jgi:dihydrofolate reductase
MAQLIYSAITSLDGYIADKDGNFDWARPDEEVHAFVNDLERRVGTYLYGRRMYEVMRCSKTLRLASSARTRIQRDFDPQTIHQMKTAATRDISVGGPELAGQAIKAGLVDELDLFLVPIVVGGGTASLPDNARVRLELLDEHRFSSGVVHLHYRTRS